MQPAGSACNCVRYGRGSISCVVTRPFPCITWWCKSPFCCCHEAKTLASSLSCAALRRTNTASFLLRAAAHARTTRRVPQRLSAAVLRAWCIAGTPIAFSAMPAAVRRQVWITVGLRTQTVVCLRSFCGFGRYASVPCAATSPPATPTPTPPPASGWTADLSKWADYFDAPIQQGLNLGHQVAPPFPVGLSPDHTPKLFNTRTLSLVGSSATRRRATEPDRLCRGSYCSTT